jgi:hypothetical protein
VAGNYNAASGGYSTTDSYSGAAGQTSPYDQRYNPYGGAGQAAGQPAGTSSGYVQSGYVTTDSSAAPRYQDYGTSGHEYGETGQSRYSTGGAGDPAGETGYSQAQPAYQPGQTDYQAGQTGYQAGQTDYQAGQTGYQPGQTDYQPGQTGYNPQGGAGYGGYDNGAGRYGGQLAEEPAYRPGGTSDYRPGNSSRPGSFSGQGAASQPGASPSLLTPPPTSANQLEGSRYSGTSQYGGY